MRARRRERFKPGAPSSRTMTDAAKRLELAIERIRPAMQMDGGDVHLVELKEDEGLVRVALSGACSGCHMSSMTMQLGIERVLKQLVPEVKTVEAV